MKMETELKGGFKTFWLQFDSTSASRRQLFCKEHSVRNQAAEYPKGHTLFVSNVPPWASLESLKETFSDACGNVTSIGRSDFKENSKIGSGVVYIVFQRESSLDKALSLPSDFTLMLHPGDGTATVGTAKWWKEYNDTVSRNEADTKRDIEEYMRDYDEKLAQRFAQEDGEENDVDDGDDGWVTVTSKKKRGKFAPARKESTIEKLQSKEERKNRKKELINFYTFQIRESKKQNLIELRKKFELDKKKLQQLKQKRTFKPF